MKTLHLFLFAFLLSLNSVFAQNTEPTTAPIKDSIKKKDDCDCTHRYIEYMDCEHKPFTSLKKDTVVGRFSLFTNLGLMPLRLREYIGNERYRSQVPAYLTWDFMEGEGALIRGLYLGGQIGMGFPIGSRFRSTATPNYEIKMNPSFYFGLHLTKDLFYAKRFKIFAMVNAQGAFNFIRVNRKFAPTATNPWVMFVQQSSGSKDLAYSDLLDGMKTTDRDNISLNQFTVQLQGSLGADILVHPNGSSFRLQVGYQLPINEMTSAWRYHYQENEESQNYRFRINAPFSYIQEGLFLKVGFAWLINKGQVCQKKTRREDCSDRYNNNNNNNDNNNSTPIFIPSFPNTPRNNTPSPPKTNPTPKNRY